MFFKMDVKQMGSGSILFEYEKLIVKEATGKLDDDEEWRMKELNDEILERMYEGWDRR